jgi:class III poly(R)-hydroxyalkanoic acid synthase PhaE subunit
MAGTANPTASMYDGFAQSQQQFFAEWSKAISSFLETARAADTSQKAVEKTREALKLYDAWKDNAGKYVDILMSACPGNAGTDTFSRVSRAADAFTRLYEVWEPLATAMQKKAVDAETYESLYDPTKYAETIENLFGFGSPAVASGLSGEAPELLRTRFDKQQEFLRPWADAMRANMDAVLAAQAGDMGAAMEVFHGLHTAFDKTFGKFLDMPAVGKDREQVELLSRTIDHYALFLAKAVELQRHMHTIAQQAMEKVVQTMAQRVNDGEPIKGFGEFVHLWSKTNEQAFLEFFRTPEYSQLQGVLLDTAMDCRRQFRQLMERVLADMPVALSSELDDLSKKNYTLSKSVRALKKKCAEVDDLRTELQKLQKKVAGMEKKLAASKSSGNGGRKTEKTP